MDELFLTKDERRRMLSHLMKTLDDAEREYINETLNPEAENLQKGIDEVIAIAKRRNDPTDSPGLNVKRLV